jgi:hypothetical protein
MRRRLVVTLVIGWIVSITAAFGIGAVFGIREEAKAAHTIRDMLAGLNALATYRSYADLASDLNAGRISSAQCKVAISGSLFIDRLQECLDDKVCSRLVLDQVQSDAPELLANPKNLSFRLYQSGERCIP